jgi:prevent-host-death family protein
MQFIQAHEARSQFGALLNRVEHGEKIAITRNGREVALLVPIPREEGETDNPFDVFRQVKERLRSEGKLTSIAEIKEAISEGRP